MTQEGGSEDWGRVGHVLASTGSAGIRELLARHDMQRPNENDVRIHTMCTRDDSPLRLDVWVRRTPTAPRARKKPRCDQTAPASPDTP